MVKLKEMLLNVKAESEVLEENAVRIREWLQEQESIDVCQDARIAHLEKENAEIKMYLAAVIQLLVKKDLIGNHELISITRVIDGFDGETDGGYSRSMDEAQGLDV